MKFSRIQWKYKILLLSIVFCSPNFFLCHYHDFLRPGLVSFSRLIFEIESKHYVYARDLINLEWKIFSKISYDTLSSLRLSNHSKYNSTIPRPRFHNLFTDSHEIISNARCGYLNSLTQWIFIYERHPAMKN